MFLRRMVFVFWISLIVIGIFVVRHRSPKHRERWIGGWVVFVLLLWELSGFVPLLYSFPSAEEAFHYAYSDEIKLTVEGDHTCLVIGGHSYERTTIKKTDSGWKNTISFATSTIFQEQQNGVVVSVFQHKASGDCYISVVVPYLLECELTDSSQSTYYECPDTNPKGSQAARYYYAYIGSVGEDYTVEVNDLKFQVT